MEEMNMYDIKAAHIKEDKQRIIDIKGKFSGFDTLKNLLKIYNEYMYKIDYI